MREQSISNRRRLPILLELSFPAILQHLAEQEERQPELHIFQESIWTPIKTINFRRRKCVDVEDTEGIEMMVFKIIG